MNTSPKSAVIATAALLATAACQPRAAEEAAATVTVRSALAGGRVAHVSAGDFFTCAAFETGSVACWGVGFNGQLGNGTTPYTSPPVMVSGITDAVDISAGEGHACAVRATGAVMCWGVNYAGQLGNGTFSTDEPPAIATPVAVVGLTDVVKVSAGNQFSCAVRSGGQVACWGRGGFGQLGNAGDTDSATPVTVAGLTDVVDVSTGRLHGCAVRATGRVVCWGIGTLGFPSDGITPTLPTAVPGITDAINVTSGEAHSCVTQASGQISCWGYALQAGAGSWGAHAETPVTISGISNATDVSGSGQFYAQGATCALRATGGVACWGFGWPGLLGNGSDADSAVPVAVSGLTDAIEVSSGYDHVCALRATGEVVCWGDARTGEFTGATIMRLATTPQSVLDITNATSIALGQSHACAVHGSGSVSCWGSGTSGALGTGSNASTSRPAAVTGIANATGVAAGSEHSCVVRSSGRVACWGEGSAGQLGDGLSTSSNVPVTVSGLTDAIAVGAGALHACAIRASGAVVCWGDAPVRDGGGVVTATSSTPRSVGGLTDAVQLAGALRKTCAVRQTGNVVCWDNRSPAPLAVEDLTDAVAVSAGYQHSCAVRAGGGVVCWPDATSLVPVAVAGITDAVAVASGQLHDCAQRSTGEVICWGSNDLGQLGDGTLTASATPVTVSGLTDATSVAVSSLYFSCALRATGGISCWGQNASGGLGNGTAGFSAVPVTMTGLAGTVGDPCSGASECLSGFCVDGVCCTDACGGGLAGDCVACSMDAGAPANGTCSPLPTTYICRLASGTCDVEDHCEEGNAACPDRVQPRDTPCRVSEGVCDVAESCDGVSAACPADEFVSMTTVCRPIADACDTEAETCGGAANCPADTRPPGCVAATEATCPPTAPPDSTCFNLQTEGESAPRITVTFTGFTVTDGTAAIVRQGEGAPPADVTNGYHIVGTPINPHFWDISTTGTFTCNLPDPADCSIEVCVFYDQDWVTNPAMEEFFSLNHDDGSGYVAVNDSIDTGANKICGHVITLSPFLLMEPLSTPPHIVVPGPISVEASSPAGAMVSYPVTASDVEDGPLAPTCSRASGETFPIGTTTVTCSATDSSGLRATGTFTVTVRDPGPVFAHVPDTIVAYATCTDGAKVTYSKPTAVDAVDGPRPVTCVPASGSMFPVNKTTVSCKATDKAGHTTVATFTVWVQYQAPTDGTFFLKPIRSNGSSIFGIGRAVPVKFQLTGASKFISDLRARLIVTKISNAIQGTVEDVGDEDGDDTDFLFKYRPSKTYAYRWKTRGETQGTYQLRADLGDGFVHQINVSLRNPK